MVIKILEMVGGRLAVPKHAVKVRICSRYFIDNSIFTQVKMRLSIKSLEKMRTFTACFGTEESLQTHGPELKMKLHDPFEPFSTSYHFLVLNRVSEVIFINSFISDAQISSTFQPLINVYELGQKIRFSLLLYVLCVFTFRKEVLHFGKLLRYFLAVSARNMTLKTLQPRHRDVKEFFYAILATFLQPLLST